MSMETVTTKNTSGNGRAAPELPPIDLPPPIQVTVMLPIDLIDESPTNPRRTFKHVEELAENIKAKGVLQDVLVRPSPGADPSRYELVFGARRFRASKLAGLTVIPGKVRTLTDAEVLELQVVENCQREDIHPLEEADGYRALRDSYGYSAEEIAAKVGKPVSTVHARLKFCSLVPAAREAFLAEKIGAGVAMVIARIPHADQQQKALKDVLERVRFNGEVTVSEAARLVQDRFMLKLVNAPFDRNDAALVAGTPSCAACPKRTGNQRELFADVDTKEDLCTDVKCFDAKKVAAWEAKKQEAAKSGTKVLSERASKQLFPWSGARVDERSGYVDLAGTTYGPTGKEHKNRTLLGKAAEVPIVIARDPEGRVHELVATEDFKAAAKAAGNLDKIKPPPRAGGDFASAQKSMRAKEAKAREAFAAELLELVDLAATTPPNDAFWRTLASGLARIVWEDTRKATCRRRGIEAKPNTEKALIAYAEGLGGGASRALAVELVVTSGRGAASEVFKAFRELYAAGGKKPATKAKPKATKARKGKAAR